MRVTHTLNQCEPMTVTANDAWHNPDMTRQLTILLVALVVIVGTAACSDTSALEARIEDLESQLEDERNKEALNQRLAALPTSVSTRSLVWKRASALTPRGSAPFKPASGTPLPESCGG